MWVKVWAIYVSDHEHLKLQPVSSDTPWTLNVWAYSSLLYIHKMLFSIVLKHSILGQLLCSHFWTQRHSQKVIFLLLSLLLGLEDCGHDKQKWWLIALLGSAEMKTALARTLEAQGAKVPICVPSPGDRGLQLGPSTATSSRLPRVARNLDSIPGFNSWQQIHNNSHSAWANLTGKIQPTDSVFNLSMGGWAFKGHETPRRGQKMSANMLAGTRTFRAS